MTPDPIKELDRKLTEYQQKLETSSSKPKFSEKGAIFVVAEIIAGVSTGGIIGHFLDQYLHTKVLFLLILVILGLISSLYNIYRKFK